MSSASTSDTEAPASTSDTEAPASTSDTEAPASTSDTEAPASTSVTEALASASITDASASITDASASINVSSIPESGPEELPLNPGTKRKRQHSLSSLPIGTYVELRAEGYSQDNKETRCAGESGDAIFKLMSISPLKLAWMQPTNQIPNCATWASAGEYTLCQPSTIPKVKPSDLVHVVNILEMQDHALGYRPAYVPGSTPNDKKYVAPFLPCKQRFTRSRWNTTGGVESDHTQCIKCRRPLRAEAFVHCRRCDKVYHNKCTEAKDRQPFQLKDGLICDNSGICIVCPKCRGTAETSRDRYLHTKPDIGKAPRYIILICFDLGSLTAKVSTKIIGPDHTDTDYQVLSNAPQSVAYVRGEDVHISPDRVNIYSLDPNVTQVRPIKRSLFDSPWYAKFNLHHAVTLESVFKSFFTYIFEQINATRRNDLHAWAEHVKATDESDVEVNIAIATPSGMAAEQKTPMLTALYTAGAAFLKGLGVAHCRPNITDLPESEAALANHLKSSLWTNNPSDDEYAWLLVVDCGGTTTDFSAHSRREEDDALRLRHHASTSIAIGTIHVLETLMSEFNFEKVYWNELLRWSVDACKDDAKADVEIGGKALGRRWRELHRTQIERLQTFAEVCLGKISKEIVGGQGVKIVLSGGGMLDCSVLDTVKAVINKYLDDPKVVLDFYSDSERSSVRDGLQAYSDYCQTIRFSQSPITVLTAGDSHLKSENPKKTYQVMVNKGDPLNPETLLPISRAYRGEPITWDIDWGTEGKPATDVPFFAQRIKAEPQTVKGLDVITERAHDRDIYPAGHIRVYKPDGVVIKEMYLSSYINILGRTILTRTYLFTKDQSVDVLACTPEQLGELAFRYEETVHALDLHRENTLADMSIFDS
ncbi:hypothetical protein M3J09_013791 [Ascochyta lentis]